MKTVGIIAVLMGLAAFASAATILDYDISSYSGTELSATNLATNVTAGNLTTSGVTPMTGQTGVYSAAEWGADSSSRDPTKYYEFTVTADEGYAISYTDITFSVYREYAMMMGMSGPIKSYAAEKWNLVASTDNFKSSPIHLLTANIETSNSGEQVLFADQDISALGAQSGTVTFRLYGYDQFNSTMYAGLSNTTEYGLTGTGSNVIVGGTVGATPECASLNMLLMGGAWLLAYRRY